jgi:hypothetical protein
MSPIHRAISSASVKDVVQGFGIEYVEHPGFRLFGTGVGQAREKRLRQGARTMGELELQEGSGLFLAASSWRPLPGGLPGGLFLAASSWRPSWRPCWRPC